jgi:hypothetical protein
MPAGAGILSAFASAFDAPLLPLRYGARLSLRSETASFPRSQPPLAGSRPSATSRQDRALSQVPGATPAALPRFHVRRLLPSLAAVACTPLRACATTAIAHGRGRFQPGCALPFPDTLSRRAAGGARSRWRRHASVINRVTRWHLPRGRSSAQAPPSVHTSKGRTTMSDKIVAPSNHSPLPPNPITMRSKRTSRTSSRQR